MVALEALEVLLEPRTARKQPIGDGYPMELENERFSPKPALLMKSSM